MSATTQHQALGDQRCESIAALGRPLNTRCREQDCLGRIAIAEVVTEVKAASSAVYSSLSCRQPASGSAPVASRAARTSSPISASCHTVNGIQIVDDECKSSAVCRQLRDETSAGLRAGGERSATRMPPWLSGPRVRRHHPGSFADSLLHEPHAVDDGFVGQLHSVSRNVDQASARRAALCGGAAPVSVTWPISFEPCNDVPRDGFHNPEDMPAAAGSFLFRTCGKAGLSVPSPHPTCCCGDSERHMSFRRSPVNPRSPSSR